GETWIEDVPSERNAMMSPLECLSRNLAARSAAIGAVMLVDARHGLQANSRNKVCMFRAKHIAE
ncbi:hypothetical protein, partial [Burkholderia ubonensis]|uniref:hypothetical protein n=1 Tax=Burkholderia ubonensis TaxID=101571 RepID=UPI000A7CA0A0